IPFKLQGEGRRIRTINRITVRGAPATNVRRDLGSTRSIEIGAFDGVGGGVERLCLNWAGEGGQKSEKRHRGTRLG
ncbi:hypothetical protein, partial [Brevundimonas sp.]|uniref:hypothetical protein n=2 Tax=Brevundimonas TaxID=41275 RepID=UPI0028975F3C